MSSNKRKSNDTSEVNPYLYLLLKKMLAYEVGRLYPKPSQLNARRYIALGRPLTTNITELKEKVRKQLESNNYPPKTSSFGKYVWEEAEDFRHSLYFLDQLARSISFTDQFDSWKKYEEKYSDSLAQRFEQYKSYTIKDLADINILSKINDAVEIRHCKAIQDAVKNGSFKGRKYKNVFSTENNFHYRCAELEDLPALSITIRDRLSNEIVLNKEILLKKNGRIFYIISDFLDDIVGHIALIPINRTFYDDFISGLKSSIDITYFDLSSQGDYILISDLFYDLKEINIHEGLPHLFNFQFSNNQLNRHKDISTLQESLERDELEFTLYNSLYKKSEKVKKKLRSLENKIGLQKLELAFKCVLKITCYSNKYNRILLSNKFTTICESCNPQPLTNILTLNYIPVI